MRIPLFVLAGAFAGAPAIAAAPSKGGAAAAATIESRSESNVTGTAKFTSAPGGVRVHLEIEEATPGPHGVHIHEKGDCSDKKALSAGGHYDPTASEHHGGAKTAIRHGGDLGNIEVGKDGKGTLDVVVPAITVESIVGRSIVVHEKYDDMKTDPSGGSGARIGCGKIEAASPP
ncbi:MAG TPA: superoxide dismutase family protein [Myxococcales bacterium]